jgi:hypothetical protein
MIIENQILRQSIERLMPSQTLEEGLRDLLLQQARRNLVKYRAMTQRFQSKYKTDFKLYFPLSWAFWAFSANLHLATYYM